MARTSPHMADERYRPTTISLQSAKNRMIVAYPTGPRVYSLVPVTRKQQMSALDQKQTCAVHKPMSAFPPKADILCVEGHVR